MTLRHLTIFTAVYETSSFTKAGNRLHLVQPSISLAIKELEEYYQVPLFDRVKRSIYPTEHGDKLYQYASHILTLFDEMESSVKNWESHRTLRIGSSITIGNKILPTLIHLFKEIYPQIDFEVVINNSVMIENFILQNRLDFALIETEPTMDKITSIPFMSDFLCTIAHPEHPFVSEKEISLEQLSGEAFLSREHGSFVRELVESMFLSHQVPFNPLWESTSTQALIRAVEANIGITTLPYQLLKQELETGTVSVLNVPQLHMERTYHIIFYKEKYLAKVTEDFIDLCKKYGSESL